MEIIKSFFNQNGKSKVYYVFFIPLVVYIFKALEMLYLTLQQMRTGNEIYWLKGIKFMPAFTATGFMTSFIEWFGVLYGFLVPLILVRVWEQFDNIDREFDREVDTVKMLYEDLQILGRGNKKLGDEIKGLLQQYVEHVIAKHPLESDKKSEERIAGDAILRQVRKKYSDLIHVAGKKEKESIPLITEMISQLNDLIDIRGDRIGLTNQRLFESLRIVALITTTIFLLPFYFAGFTVSSGILDNLLVFFVTLLVLFIYVILEDLDEPFSGIWSVDKDAWERLLKEIQNQ
jgi:hypothetical protein